MHCRKSCLLLLGMILLCGNIISADMRLGIFYKTEIQSIVFSVIEGEYILSAGDQQIAVIRKGTMIHIGRTSQGLTVEDTLTTLGTFHKLNFKGISAANVFRIRPVLPSLPAKESDDDLIMGIRKNFIEIINILDLEKYISGCVEAEGGSNAGPEFYKAQAVLSRTFAIKNFTRHAVEGFNLCDGVHCQAFNGKSRMNPVIYDAVLETRDIILVDPGEKPIMTAFHANCGGMTSSASMVWNKDLPYLISIRDPFCDASPQHEWSKSITLADWDHYLESKGFRTGSGTLLSITDTVRQQFLDTQNRKLPLTVIREDLKLKSSFFTLQSRNGSVILKGHGYGHGVGMCQEGAIEMARVGYTYVDILMFYFHNVKLEKR